jgi:hypothetical protein
MRSLRHGRSLRIRNTKALEEKSDTGNTLIMIRAVCRLRRADAKYVFQVEEE